MKITLNRTTDPVPENWHESVLVLWTEDECLRRDPTAEHLPEAWKCYTQQTWTRREPLVAHYDGGDVQLDLYPRGWVVIASFDGDSIGRLVKVDMRKKTPGVEAAEIIAEIRERVIEEVAVMFDTATADTTRSVAAEPEPARVAIGTRAAGMCYLSAQMVRDMKNKVWSGDFGVHDNRIKS